MLNRRTNILLNEADYMALNQLAKSKDKTVGELIRTAIKSFYKLDHSESSIEKILRDTKRLAKKINLKNFDYKEMVNYGRKY